ncbi:glutaminase [Mycobacterium sp. ACS4331]|nr:glutaminase [Mycobacterium sp. ACS4331]
MSYGPALDDSANSIGGVRLMRLLAQEFGVE